MRLVSNYIRRGKIGTWTLVYLLFVLIEIITIIITTVSGNFAGWVGALLGFIVCFPWSYIGPGIIKYFGLRLDDYMPILFVVSILINFMLMYNIDGKKYRLMQKSKT